MMESNKKERTQPKVEDWRKIRERAVGYSYKKLTASVNEELKQIGLKEEVNERNLTKVLNGQSRGLYLTEALALSKVLRTNLIDFLRSDCAELGEFAGIQLHRFATLDDMYQFLLEQESGGRIAILSEFPSEVFPAFSQVIPIEPTEKKYKRAQNIVEHPVLEMEFYPIRALLSFAFSPIGDRYLNSEKRRILKTMISMFQRSNLKELFLFDSRPSELSEFSNMEIFPAKGSIITVFPFAKHTMAQTVLIEIQNTAVVKQLSSVYLENKDSRLPDLRGELAIQFLQLLNEHLEGDHYDPDRLLRFVKACRNPKVSKHFAEPVWNNLSISLRQTLSL